MEIREIQPQPTVSIRTKVSMAEIGPAMGDILPRVAQWCSENGVVMAGAPYARYYAMEGDQIDFEAGIPVATAVPGTGEIQAGELPGGKVGYHVHVGPYATINESAAALHQWINDQGLAARGSFWERTEGYYWEAYIDDPTEVAEADLRSELYLAIR